MSGGTLSKAHYKYCSTSPVCAVLTELGDRNCVKAIANYAELPSTSKETKVLAPVMLNFKLPIYGYILE